MTIVLIILGIYIGMVVVSLLSPYVDFKKKGPIAQSVRAADSIIRRSWDHVPLGPPGC